MNIRKLKFVMMFFNWPCNAGMQYLPIPLNPLISFSLRHASATETSSSWSLGKMGFLAYLTLPANIFGMLGWDRLFTCTLTFLSNGLKRAAINCCILTNILPYIQMQKIILDVINITVWRSTLNFIDVPDYSFQNP